MHIIDLTPVEEGVYCDHKADHITEPPEGWAMIPEDFPLPSTFPRLGSIEAEPITYTYDVEVKKVNEETGKVEIITEQREKVIMTVTEMTEGTLPEPVEPEPTLEERVADVEEQLLATDEVAVELYENQLAQEEINIAQDEALCELYELMGV